MLTLSWRKAGASSALAMALVVGLPALAQAQLFPNLWIQRERNACANEPPFYAHVRHNYYGYFPTCWRRFPEGWACPCPNPELPDAAASFVRQPRDAKPKLPPPETDDLSAPLLDNRGAAPAPGGGADRRGADEGGFPPLPPSALRPLNEAPDNRNPAPAPGTTPGRPGQPGTPPTADPFDPVRPNMPRSDAGSSSRGPVASEGPTLEPPQGAMSGEEPAPVADAFSNPGSPVLALPEMPQPSTPRPVDPTVATATMPSSLPPDGSTVELPPVTNPEPAQAPKRTGLLGGLFNNLSNWRRR
jgi:hypothetical protein